MERCYQFYPIRKKIYIRFVVSFAFFFLLLLVLGECAFKSPSPSNVFVRICLCLDVCNMLVCMWIEFTPLSMCVLVCLDSIFFAHVNATSCLPALFHFQFKRVFLTLQPISYTYFSRVTIVHTFRIDTCICLCMCEWLWLWVRVCSWGDFKLFYFFFVHFGSLL